MTAAATKSVQPAEPPTRPSSPKSAVIAVDGTGACPSRAVRVQILPTSASWFGVTYREDRPFVTQGIQGLLDSGDYPERLWQ